MATSGGDASIDTKIEAWRKGLLDLTKKNPLSSFRVSSRSRRQLELVEPPVSQLFEWLCQGRSCSVAYREPVPGQPDDDDAHDADRSAGGSIRTNRSLTINWRTLNTLEKKAREFEQEQGINVLSVALGFLEWPEAASSDQRRLAPLLFVPVSLTDEPALSRYRLAMVDDDPVVNPVLKRLLLNDHGIDLPGFEVSEVAPAHGFDAWMEELVALLTGRERWAVQQRSFLGLFSFLKLVMYEDLDRNRAEAAVHPVIRALAGASDTRSVGFDVEAPRPEKLDELVPPSETYQILDADASQQVAIEVAKRGGSFILHGPPGTGKSQTIANLIAEFLAAGKTVLFVSEKMAALDVVLGHLERHHLADFCLPLHSHKARKSEVYPLLATSQEGMRVVAATQELDPALQSLRLSLNERSSQLNAPVSPLGRSPVWVMGELDSLRTAPTLSFAFDHAEQVDRERYADLQQHVASLKQLYRHLLDVPHNPWRGSDERVRIDDESLASVLEELASLFSDLVPASDRMARVSGLAKPRSLGEFDLLCKRCRLLAVSPQPPVHWLTDRDLDKVRENVAVAAEMCRAYRDREGGLVSATSQAFLDLDHPRLLDALQPPPLLCRLRPISEAEATFVDKGRALLDLVVEALGALRRLRETGAAMAEAMDQEPPASIETARALLNDAEIFTEVPPIERSWLHEPERSEAVAMAQRGAKLAEAAAEAREKLVAASATALLDDTTATLQAALRRAGVPVLAFLSRRRLRALLADLGRVLGRAQPPTFPEAADLLAAASCVRKAYTWLESNDAEARRLLGAHFTGRTTDWAGTLQALKASPTVSEVLSRCRTTGGRLRTIEYLSLPAPERALLAERYDAARRALEEANASLGALPDWFVWSDARDVTTELIEPLLAELDPELAPAAAYLDAYDEAVACYGLVLAQGRPCPSLVRQHLEEAIGLFHDREHGGLAAHAPRLQKEFGPFFNGHDSDWAEVLKAVEWAQAVRSEFGGRVPRRVVGAVSDGGKDLVALRQCQQDCESLAQRLEAPRQRMQELFPRGLDGTPLCVLSLSDLTERVTSCQQELASRHDWLELRRWQARASQLGLDGFVEAAVKASLEPNDVDRAFWRRFWKLWLERVSHDRPHLESAGVTEMMANIERFRAADRGLIKNGCARVRSRLADQRPAGGYGAIATGGHAFIRHEALKTRRQQSLRALFEEAGFAVQELRPCFMMSPLSVATFLGQSKMSFDAVVFDEASQVWTQDAVGAILRGEQLIVAGDERQLPPTSFFQRSLDYDEEEPEEEQVGNYASVLEELASAGLPRHRLRWHYRSRREALIAFSNRHIYGDDPLETFPEPEQGATADPALSWVHVPDGRFSGRHGNAIEAKRVAQLVIDHFRKTPRWSLGVIAFGQSHQQAVEEALRAELRESPELQALFATDRNEAFFIKNLETVQGDERDAIILTVGYGRGQDGQLRLQFGPLSNEGGERRLNVAITRAKHALTVVSSVRADELKVDGSEHPGPRLLRDYLRYAETGWLETDSSADRYDSPLEEDVCRELRARGLLVDTQVGCSGYRIDMAIRDATSGRYVLGIECDGAMYHSAKTARDRDRLRQDVLEQRGWRLLRIWSTDWLRDRHRQVERVIRALAEPPPKQPAAEMPAPVAVSINGPPMDARSVDAPSSEVVAAPAQMPGTVPYRQWQVEMLNSRRYRDQDVFYNDLNAVAALLDSIVGIEGPISLDRATERVCSAYGFRRRGGKIRAQVESAATLLQREGKLLIKGEFLWPPGLATAPVRYPPEGYEPRYIEDVPLEEIQEAAVLIVRGAGGIRPDDLVTAVRGLLGYKRTGQDIAERIGQGLAELDRDPRVALRDNQYYPEK